MFSHFHRILLFSQNTKHMIRTVLLEWQKKSEVTTLERPVKKSETSLLETSAITCGLKINL